MTTCGQFQRDIRRILEEISTFEMLPLDEQYVEITINGKSEKIPSLVRQLLVFLNGKVLNYRSRRYCCNGMWFQLSPFKFELPLCE